MARKSDSGSRVQTLLLPPLDSAEARALARMGIAGVRAVRDLPQRRRPKGGYRETVPVATRSLLWVVRVSEDPTTFFRELRAFQHAVKSGAPVPILVQYFDRPWE